MEENELIKQFIRDLYYIDDIEKGTHVFERITKIIEKWEKYISQDFSVLDKKSELKERKK